MKTQIKIQTSSSTKYNSIGSNKKYVFRGNPSLPKFLLVKPRIFFSGFLEKCIILCIWKGDMPFKMHKGGLASVPTHGFSLNFA